MNILLTGGSGDLGTWLTPHLLSLGHRVSVIDLIQPGAIDVHYYPGSILDPATLRAAMAGADIVIHIAAWHGIHAGIKSEAEFHDLNIVGTENIVRCWTEGLFENLLFISSSSVLNADSYYGETKRQAEAHISHTAQKHQLKAISLRPRGFIPSSNRAVYDSFQSWAQYFYTGGVHIDDVGQAVLLALKALPSSTAGNHPCFMVDRYPDFKPDELATWDLKGPGTTFAANFPDQVELARQNGLPIHTQPLSYSIADTQKQLAYNPRYGIQELLQDLQDQ